MGPKQVDTEIRQGVDWREEGKMAVKMAIRY